MLLVKTPSPRNTFFLPTQRLLMIVGNYGSGKTEVSVNLAIALREEGHEVQIADLDIVNPYFRCREARELMRRKDIRVVVPPGQQVSADLPIVLPEISGMFTPPKGRVSIFDVGGDDVGARLLSSFEPIIAKQQKNVGGEKLYELWQVINAKRPFTETVEGCMKMRDAIEKASRLKVTGLVGNTHLMEETTEETLLEGWELTQKVSEKTGLPVAFVTAMSKLAEAKGLKQVKAPIFELRRYMLPPWLASKHNNETEGSDKVQSASGDDREGQAGVLPAARPIPLGRPPGVE